MMIIPKDEKKTKEREFKKTNGSVKEVVDSLEQKNSGRIRIEDIESRGIQGIMGRSSHEKGLVLDLTGRCSWGGKDWDLSTKKKRSYVIDKIIGKSALLVITEDVNKGTER